MVIGYSNSNFKIDGKVKKGRLNLLMKINEEKNITTKFLPATLPILTENLPSILKCQCFNDQNNSFGQECKNTELGHLFEHIMLEYLCIEKIQEGSSKASYEGITNWQVDIPEVFDIEIKAGLKDIKNIKKAFEKSVDLISKILT